MKRNFLLWAIVLLCPWTMWAQSDSVIRIGTQRTDLVLRVTPEGKLTQAYLGPRLLNAADCQQIPAGVGREVYFAYGSNDYFEPAIRVTHADGHPGMQLDYVSQEVVPQSDPNVQLTVVTLRDKVYPLEVKLFYETYDRENVIKMWTEIRHDEKKAVVLHEEASAMLYMSSPGLLSDRVYRFVGRRKHYARTALAAGEESARYAFGRSGGDVLFSFLSVECR